MDAAGDKGAAGYGFPVPQLSQILHTGGEGLGKQEGFHLVIVGEPVLAPGGVEDPVSDIDHVQQTAILFLRQFKLHHG